jgi:protein-S-isoprenylcysteine O-methyltransferase Ste14
MTGWMSVHFATRGWVLAALYVVLFAARHRSDAPLRPEWLLFVLAAIALRLWAGAHLGDHGNAARPEAPRLCKTGPYRFSRNPLYLSNMLAGAGLVLFANATPVMVTTILLLALYFHHFLLVTREEAHLRRAFGHEFEVYAAAVPAWIGVPLKDADLPVRVEGSAGAAATGGGGVTLRTILARQGRNVVYAVACAVILWLIGR